jgi:hypothetical protein
VLLGPALPLHRRGLAELDWPYTDDPQVRARYEVMEYPVGISLLRLRRGVGDPLADRVAGRRRARDQPTGDLVGTDQVKKELRGFVIVNALVFAALALLSAWLLAGVNPGGRGTRPPSPPRPALLLTGLINWDMLAVVLVAGALGPWARGRRSRPAC